MNLLIVLIFPEIITVLYQNECCVLIDITYTLKSSFPKVLADPFWDLSRLQIHKNWWISEGGWWWWWWALGGYRILHRMREIWWYPNPCCLTSQKVNGVKAMGRSKGWWRNGFQNICVKEDDEMHLTVSAPSELVWVNLRWIDKAKIGLHGWNVTYKTSSVCTEDLKRVQMKQVWWNGCMK